jgi:hypothetical protein
MPSTSDRPWKTPLHLSPSSEHHFTTHWGCGGNSKGESMSNSTSTGGKYMTCKAIRKVG